MSNDQSEMVDEREARLDTRSIPPWVVTEAIGRAIDADVQRVQRDGENFRVLVDSGDDNE